MTQQLNAAAGHIQTAADIQPLRYRGVDDLVAIFLAAICVLNLNGAVSMLTGVGQSFSVPMLLCATFLVLRRMRAAYNFPMMLLMLAIGSYLVLANLYYDPQTSVADPLVLSNAYLNTILLLVAMVGYVGSLSLSGREVFGRRIRILYLVAACATLASPSLYQVFVNLPPSAQQRMGGLFGNPNEAAFAGVLAAAFTLAFPFRRLPFQVGALALASVAVVLTLSKAGMSALVLVLLAGAVKSLHGLAIWISAFTAAIAILLIQDPSAWVLGLIDGLNLNLSEQQLARVLAVGDILSGRIDEQTSTNRSYIWQLVLQDAWARFPYGGGIGSAHFYVGGVLEGDVWQGAHNSFLLFLAEAGPIPAVLLIASLVFAARRLLGLDSSGARFLVILFVLLVEMFSSHNGLTARYCNIALAFVFGMASAARSRTT